MKKIVTLFLMLGAVLSMNAKSINPSFSREARDQQVGPKMLVSSNVFSFTEEELQLKYAEAQLKKSEVREAAPAHKVALGEVTTFEIDGATFLYVYQSYYGIFNIYSYTIYGESDEAIVGASIGMSFEEIEKTGTFDKAVFDTVMFALIDGADTVMVDVETFSITVSEEEDGSMIGIASITDSEGNEYEVTLRYIIPDPKDTVVVHFDAMQGMYYDGYGYLVYADNANYAVQVLIKSETLEGEFGNQDINKDYSGLVLINGTDSTYMESYSISVVGEKNLAEDSIYLTINYFAKDSTMYECHMGYKIPALTGDTINVVVAQSEVDDSYLSSYGDLAIYGLSADGSKYALMDLYINDAITGSYTEADLESQYTYFGVFVGTDTTWYMVKTAAITVASAGTDAYTMTGEFVCYPEGDPSSLVVFTLSMPFEYSAGGGGSEYDLDGTTNVTKTYTQGTDDVAWDYSYASQYSLVYLDVAAADGSDQVMLEFNTNATSIPAGVYNIASSGTGIYVSASTGYDGTYIYPSFYATTSGGYISTPWYMVSGTVTVSATQIVIAAVNSNSKTINITINLSGSGVEEVEAEKEVKAEKVLNNGILNIKRDGHVYDMMGAKLK